MMFPSIVDITEENDYFRLPSKATWNLFPGETGHSKENIVSWARNGFQQVARNEAPSEPNKVRVLLVEDSAAQRLLMKRRIESVRPLQCCRWLQINVILMVLL